MMKALFGPLLVVFSQLGFAQSTDLSLTVEMFGASPNKGEAILSLFSSEEDYLKHPLLTSTQIIDGDSLVKFKLIGLAKGKYSVSLVYDKNSNGKLDVNFLGIPSEPVGFSNNVKGSFGPPDFRSTSFNFDKSTTLQIYLGNARD